MLKYKTNIGIKDFYGDYQAFVQDRYEGLTALPKSEYKEVIGEVNKRIVELIIEEQFRFNMPFHLGNISVVSKHVPKDINKMLVDWGRTNKLWAENSLAKERKTLVYHTNEHSNGIYSKFLYCKPMYPIKNISLYSFIPTRANKRALAKAAKENKVKHVFINK